MQTVVEVSYRVVVVIELCEKKGGEAKTRHRHAPRFRKKVQKTTAGSAWAEDFPLMYHYRAA